MLSPRCFGFCGSAQSVNAFALRAGNLQKLMRGKSSTGGLREDREAGPRLFGLRCEAVLIPSTQGIDRKIAQRELRGLPWIDKPNAAIFKVGRVAGGEGGSVG